MRIHTLKLLVAGALASAVGAANGAVLYDATLGTLPSAQGWAFVATPLFLAKANQSFAGGVATVDSTAVRTDKGGWFANLPPFGKHPGLPSLDATAGFVVGFTARVGSEDHASNDRAGFSVIVTASNLSSIELGFWPGEIWAQSGADFHHAEGAPFNTTAELARYDLEVAGGRYRLSANGVRVLEGDLRRYDAFGTPYNVADFLFFGDDTSSAQASASLGRVTVSPLPRVTVERRAGGVTLGVAVDSGREVAFEASEDLVTWTAVGTATGVAGQAKLDTGAEGGARFFRASLR